MRDWGEKYEMDQTFPRQTARGGMSLIVGVGRRYLLTRKLTDFRYPNGLLYI